MAKKSRAIAHRGPSHRYVEYGVAALCIVLGLITIAGSVKVGIGWGPEGPKSGFFPFYIGLLIVGASLITCIELWLDKSKDHLFAEWGQLRQVMSVVIPTTFYTLVIPYLGIYLSSFILIAGFMKWLGKYPWRTTIAVAIGTPAAIFVMFEKWFLIPLPKGPLENLLGL